MSDKPIAMTEWLEMYKELCNPKDIIPFSIQEAQRKIAIIEALPTSIRIIEAILAANEDAGIPSRHAERIAERVLNEKERGCLNRTM